MLNRLHHFRTQSQPRSPRRARQALSKVSLTHALSVHPLARGVHPPRCHGNTKRFGGEIGASKRHGRATRGGGEVTADGRDGSVARSAKEGGCEEGTVARIREVAGGCVTSATLLALCIPLLASLPSRLTSPAARIFPPVARRPPTRARGILRRHGARAKGRRRKVEGARRWMRGGRGVGI